MKLTEEQKLKLEQAHRHLDITEREIVFIFDTIKTRQSAEQQKATA